LHGLASFSVRVVAVGVVVAQGREAGGQMGPLSLHSLQRRTRQAPSASLGQHTGVPRSMADHPEYTSLANVHRFNAGQMPVMQGLEDFYHFAEDDPERVANLVPPRPQAD
jgi:hypothetical protein